MYYYQRLLAYKENTPRVSLRLLHVRINSFRVFCEYVKILSAYSETILCTSNNAVIKYTERKTNTQEEIFTFNYAWGGDFKGTVFKKMHLPRMNSLQKFNFLDIFKTTTALCVYREYAKRRNKQ